MTADPLLAVENVDASYDGARVLHDVSFAVPDDAITCLLGRNGMGKTTTLKAVMNVVPPTAGRVVYRGEDITDEPVASRVRRGISYVPQERGFFPTLTVAENLAVSKVGGDLTTADRETLFGLFPRLEQRTDQQAGNLSGGERQMLKIGKTLLNDPDLLLLDEITEGLQPSLVKDLVGKLLEIQSERSLGILLVEQNVPFCDVVGDRFVFMAEGEIRATAEGDLVEHDDLIRRYIGPYSESLEVE